LFERTKVRDGDLLDVHVFFGVRLVGAPFFVEGFSFEPAFYIFSSGLYI
jgi:hypothetical protein